MYEWGKVKKVLGNKIELWVILEQCGCTTYWVQFDFWFVIPHPWSTMVTYDCSFTEILRLLVAFATAAHKRNIKNEAASGMFS